MLDDWQVDVLDAALAERADGRWAAREVALICPRQNGKGAILEAVELAGLFLFDERLILHSAHEFKTATEAFLRIWHHIETTPDLERLVYRKLQNNNDMSVELTTGQRLRFVARTGGSGRGFSGDRIVLDEAFNLPERALAALMPTLSARPNPQVWFTSSAPMPTVESDVLRRICKRGREGSARLCYFEYAARDDAAVDDPTGWFEANPALGIERADGSGITEDDIEAELAVLSPDDFIRERLGWWVENPTGVWTVVPGDAWRQKVGPKPSKLTAWAVDVAPMGASAAIAVSDGVAVDVVEHGAMTGWVVPRLVELRARHKVKRVTLDEVSGGQLVEPFEAAGFQVTKIGSRDMANACDALLTAIVDPAAAFWHPDREPLNVAVAGAVKRDVGDGGWAWSRRRSNVDITPLVAVTLARWVASTGQKRPADFFMI